MKSTANFCFAFNSDFSETVTYNNPLFPAYIKYNILSCYPDYSCISHWHKDLEFILVKKGVMTYNVNDEQFQLSKGTGIMVNSRQLHFGFSPTHNACEFICILLSPELLEGSPWFYQNYIEPIIENPSHPYLLLDSTDWKSAILERIELLYTSFNINANSSDSYFVVIEHFASIMKTLYKNLNLDNQLKMSESVELVALRNMITFIEKHYAEHITLSDIALAGSCCKSKCSQLFKKFLHDTPIRYTTKFRLQKSVSALLESDKSIMDIAYEYGFGGASYYCETFKKFYKESPFVYKKANQKKL